MEVLFTLHIILSFIYFFVSVSLKFEEFCNTLVEKINKKRLRIAAFDNRNPERPTVLVIFTERLCSKLVSWYNLESRIFFVYLFSVLFICTVSSKRQNWTPFKRIVITTSLSKFQQIGFRVFIHSNNWFCLNFLRS